MGGETGGSSAGVSETALVAENAALGILPVTARPGMMGGIILG